MELPKAILYAKSVNDYSSGDTFVAQVFDAKRKQIYLSAGDHVDVFSIASNQFMAPLHPAANGLQKQFAGLALTPRRKPTAGCGFAGRIIGRHQS
jgi:hypothetical protein